MLSGFARDKLLGPTALLDGFDALKSALKIVIDEQTDSHDAVVVDLPNHTGEFGPELLECPMQVVQCVAMFGRLHLIDNLVREVDVALHQVHVIEKLVVLGGNAFLVVVVAITRSAF